MSDAPLSEPEPPWAAGTDTRSAELYPVLTEAQARRMARFGEPCRFAPRQIVWRAGERGLDLHLVISGALEVLRVTGDGAETTVAVHGPRQFSGETNLLTDRASLVMARAAGDLETVRVPAASLRELIARDPELSEILMHAFILRRMRLIAKGLSDVRVVGSSFSADTLRVRSFLIRNGHPHGFLDLEACADVEALLETGDFACSDVPLVYAGAGPPLRNPSLSELAERLGLMPRTDPETIYDVVVIGAGPAGLATAVYAASEGLSTAVLETVAPGGQAGASSKIENYLGFPTGISGHALAGRAFTQAAKFGADILVPSAVSRLICDGRGKRVELEDGRTIRARSVVIASGANYRRLDLPELGRYEGAGVHYGAGHMEAGLCRGQDVIVVGGGNSAGQAAIYLSAHAREVSIMVRREGLEATMSRYLIARIEQAENITVRPFHEISALEGGGHLEHVCWRDTATGKDGRDPVSHLFLFVGADPCTRFVEGDIALDEKGFVKTGPSLTPEDLAGWPLAREPFLLETSHPFVFAAGDVRSGSIKRVASAVGEGSITVQFIHQALAGLQGASAAFSLPSSGLSVPGR